MISLLSTLILGLTSDSCNKKDILLNLGYNYNMMQNKITAWRHVVYVMHCVQWGPGTPPLYARFHGYKKPWERFSGLEKSYWQLISTDLYNLSCFRNWRVVGTRDIYNIQLRERAGKGVLGL